MKLDPRSTASLLVAAFVVLTSPAISEEPEALLEVIPEKLEDAKALSRKYPVQGLPALIILTPDGSVASLTGLTEVMSSPEAALDTWKKASQS